VAVPASTAARKATSLESVPIRRKRVQDLREVVVAVGAELASNAARKAISLENALMRQEAVAAVIMSLPARAK
jgi:hypothetical protein